MVRDVLGTVVRKIVDLPEAMLRVICDLVEKLAGEASQEWLAELKKFLRKEICWVVRNTYTKLISGDESLILDAVDGTEIMANAADVFAAGIDPDLKNWGADEPGQPTAETPVVVREMCEDATFAQMFGELNPNVSKLCLTQHQIINFVKKHRQHLRADRYATFFLFKSQDNFFVACVNVFSSDELDVYVVRFENSNVWSAERRPRLVVPQLQ